MRRAGPGGDVWWVESFDPCAHEFKFWMQKDSGAAHPDASFRVAEQSENVTIGPGETWAPCVPYSARITVTDD